MADTKNFTLKDLQAVARSLGFDPTWVTEMHISVDEVSVTYIEKDRTDLAEDGAVVHVTHTYPVGR